jgi:hypothetical protein
MTRKTVEGNEAETKVKATHSVAFEAGGYGGREERSVNGRIASETGSLRGLGLVMVD